MIQLSDKYTEPSLRQMWKICFEDTDAFIEFFFSQKYRHENTLVYIEDEKAVAALQMLPYTITFYGQEIPFAYLAGLCTLPEYRNRGCMPRLIHHAHQLLKERNIPLSILIPAEEWLFGYYGKFDYERVFDKSEKPIYSLDKILRDSPDIEDAYPLFDSLYRQTDFCVQKSFQDFKTIVEEYRNDGSPEKYNLAGMARVIDEKYLLQLYADKNPLAEVNIKVEEHAYSLKNGSVELSDIDCALDINRRLLCRLLFGYKTNSLSEPYRSLFPEHHPIMNLMLE